MDDMIPKSSEIEKDLVIKSCKTCKHDPVQYKYFKEPCCYCCLLSNWQPIPQRKEEPATVVSATVRQNKKRAEPSLEDEFTENCSDKPVDGNVKNKVASSVESGATNPSIFGWDMDLLLESFTQIASNLKAQGETSRSQAVLYLIERVRLAEAEIDRLRRGIEKVLREARK